MIACYMDHTKPQVPIQKLKQTTPLYDLNHNQVHTAPD